MTQQYKRRVEQVRSVRGSRQRAQAGLETDHSLSNVPTGLGAVDVQPDQGPGWAVYEYVIVHGRLDAASDDELEKWIQTYPIS
jgi:hypothetical protein